jgi:hypothetical protein
MNSLKVVPRGLSSVIHLFRVFQASVYPIRTASPRANSKSVRCSYSPGSWRVSPPPPHRCHNPHYIDPRARAFDPAGTGKHIISQICRWRHKVIMHHIQVQTKALYTNLVLPCVIIGLLQTVKSAYRIGLPESWPEREWACDNRVRPTASTAPPLLRTCPSIPGPATP